MLRGLFISFLCTYATVSLAFMPKSFKAQVVQKQKSALSGKLKESRGELSYRYPGHLRFEIERPEEVIFVSNNIKTWYYTGPFIDGESGEVTVSNEGNHILTKFFDSFSKGLKTNSLYSVKKDGEKVEVIFDKKLQEQLGVLSATFNFKTQNYNFKELKGLKILQHDKQNLTLSLEEIETDPKLSKKTFVFEVPKNTKVIQ